MDPYTASFLDPFNVSFPQPKILDGSQTRSSGLKFRQTGQLTLTGNASPTYVVLFPGLSSGLTYKLNAADGNPYVTTNPFPTFLGTTTDRDNVRRTRIVSSGLKLSLLNSSDDNEGYWEAIRIPVEKSEFVDFTAPVGEDYRLKINVGFVPADFANYNTFQTGRLRDLDRFMFKLNSIAPDHPWVTVLPGSSAPTVGDCLDNTFDMIVIRMYGRIDAVTPSTIQYDYVQNMEVVYKDDTVMARLATLNIMLPNMNVILDQTRFILPAIQVA